MHRRFHHQPEGTAKILDKLGLWMQFSGKPEHLSSVCEVPSFNTAKKSAARTCSVRFGSQVFEGSNVWKSSLGVFLAPCPGHPNWPF